jgi:hypothetical protein
VKHETTLKPTIITYSKGRPEASFHPSVSSVDIGFQQFHYLKIKNENMCLNGNAKTNDFFFVLMSFFNFCGFKTLVNFFLSLLRLLSEVYTS